MTDDLEDTSGPTYHNNDHNFNWSSINISGSGPVHNGNVYGNVVHNHHGRPTGEDSELREALFQTDPETDRKKLMLAKGERVEGTCQWILHEEAYLSWLRSDVHILSILGGPGKGKTMLADFIISHLESIATEEDCLAYFFCLNSDNTRNNVCSVLRGLIYQVVRHRTDLLWHLELHLEQKERRQAVLSSPDILWSIVLAIAADPHVGKVTFVLDGLDECYEDSYHFLVDRLRSANPDLRFLISSRPLHPLRDFKHIELERNDQEISRDVHTYISHQIERLEQRLTLDPQFKQDLHDQLALKSSDTFLWISFATSELLQQRSQMAIRECLSQLPKGLPAFYERMLLQISKAMMPLCRSLLQWAAMAIRPLTLAEMADVLGPVATESTPSEADVLDVITECGSMVSYQVGKVVLVHQSARDFLCRIDVDETSALWRIDPGKSHADILRACVDRLESSTLQQQSVEFAQLSLDEKAREGSPPMLRYAMDNLVAHARLVPELENSVFGHRFFSSKTHGTRSQWSNSCLWSVWHNETRIDDRYWMACCYNILPWLRYLLTHRKRTLFWWNDLNANAMEGLLVLAFNNSYADILDLLLQHGANANAGDRASGRSILHTAVGPEGPGFGMPSLPIIRSLVKHGARLEGQDKNGETVLYQAIWRGNEELNGCLVDLGAPVDAKNGPLQETALMRAVHRADVGNVRFLLRAGASVNQKDRFGSTALHSACGVSWKLAQLDDTIEIVQLLASHGADVRASKPGKFGGTPLFIAAQYISVYSIRQDIRGLAVSLAEDAWKQSVIKFLSDWYRGITAVIIQHAAELGPACEVLWAGRVSHVEQSISGWYQSIRYTDFYRQHDPDSEGRPLPAGVLCGGPMRTGYCANVQFDLKKLEEEGRDIPKSLAVQHRCLDCSGVIYCTYCLSYAFCEHKNHSFQTLDYVGNVIETWTV